MFTKNWYKAISNIIRYGGGSSMQYKNTSNSYCNLNIVVADPLHIGREYDIASVPSLYRMKQGLSGSGGVIIGTGTTPPTLDDYYLSGDLITGYTYSAAVSNTYDGDRVTITALYTITNTSAADFTVGEIGLIANLYQYNDASGDKKALLERTVLDSPVTIPAGGVGQITYTITIEYPA